MDKIRIVFICFFAFAILLTMGMHSKAANYMDQDEIFRKVYGKTREEVEQEFARQCYEEAMKQLEYEEAKEQQQYYEELRELQRQDDEGKLIQFVRSKEELFEAICYQIKDHREEIYYDTDEVTLYYQKDGFMDEFNQYYCKNAPLISGYYLANYLKGVITYKFHEKYVKEDGRYRIGILIDFKYTKEEFERHMKDMSELAAQLKCDNDYDSVKAVHDYLIEKIDYDHEYKHYDDLAGMKDGVMVCQAYSMAAYNLLSNMGIPVKIICGVAYPYNEFDGHAWNIVCLDGKWYHMDVTWDDLGEDGVYYKYFLKGSQDFLSHIPDNAYQKMAGMVSAASYGMEGEMEDGVEDGTEEMVEQAELSGKDSEHSEWFRRSKIFILMGVYVILSVIVRICRVYIEESESRR